MSKHSHHAAVRLVVDNSSSAASDTPRSRHARSKDKCQEPGMLFRVRHLRTWKSVAPADLAASAIAGQREGEKMSMPAYRDSLSPLSRPSVPLKDKTALPHWGMADTAARSLYRKQLKARMKAERERRGLTQAEMASKLRITADSYKKMEQRGALPVDLMEPFANICGVSPCYMLTGEMPRARTPAPPAQEEPPPVRARKAQ